MWPCAARGGREVLLDHLVDVVRLREDDVVALLDDGDAQDVGELALVLGLSVAV